MDYIFDGEEFREDLPIPIDIGTITYIEQIWGKIYGAIPKHLRINLEARFKSMYEMTEDEAQGFIYELKQYLPNEYPVNGTVDQQTRWMRKNII